MSIPPRVRAAVYARDRQRCRRCGAWAEGGSIHHRRPRGMGGTKDPRTNDLRNLVLLCGSGTTGCHGLIESDRAKARQYGWLVPTLEQLDDPILTRWGWVRLFSTGWASPAYLTREGASSSVEPGQPGGPG